MLDIDDLAIKSTLENAAFNGVQDRITAQQGSLDTLKTTSRHFDLLLCNILAKAIIIEMCDQGWGCPRGAAKPVQGSSRTRRTM
jgi:ribosomal protein L11 methylase PrmA